MKKLALGALIAGLTACGGGSNNTVNLLDAPPLDVVSVCNPLTQGGCDPGQKCTWINDQDDPPIGHVGCAPDPGASGIAIGGACTAPTAGPMGYDTCVKGAVCLSGECKQICDQAGGAPNCGETHSCTRYADFFEVAGSAVAGVCDPACDPLTQDLKVGAVKHACGSSSATMPTKGCYGYDDYSCAPAGPSVYELTDGAQPRTNSSGNPYLNGCAPGFIPFFYERTGSTVTKCSGLCAALEVDRTDQPPPAAGVFPDQGAETRTMLSPADRELGYNLAVGKMPTTVKNPGDAVCTATKKGRPVEAQTCKYMWYYVRDRTTGEVPPLYLASPMLDTLGVCQSYNLFEYDHDMNPATPVEKFPDCKTLPRLTASTTDEDAADWGCQKYSNSMFVNGKPKVHPALSDMRVPKDLPLEIVRHDLQ